MSCRCTSSLRFLVESMAESFSILETSPVTLTTCLAVLIICSLILEKGLHALHNYLHERDRRGMISALDNMKNELMLLGFASLVLIMFENRIARFCGE